MSHFSVSSELQKNYKDYYEGDSEWRRLSAVDKAANLVRLCLDCPHGRVLDIGAGEGSLVKRLDELNFGENLYALEISPSGVEAIRQKGITKLAGCELFDGYTLSYPDGYFNLVILSHVLEHVEHPRRLLDEAGRVAQRVFIEVPLEDTLRMPHDFKPSRVGHINFFSPITIRRLVQTCGFEVLAQVVTNPSRAVYSYRYPRNGLVKYWIKELGLRLLPGLGPRLWSFHSALLCKPPRQDKQCRVVLSYQAQYPNVQVMHAGEEVNVEQRQSDWPGWSWCMTSSGNSAWVPDVYLVQNGQNAYLRIDYNPAELSVQAGEELILCFEESGWALCQHPSGRSGWVPLEHLERLNQ